MPEAALGGVLRQLRRAQAVVPQRQDVALAQRIVAAQHDARLVALQAQHVGQRGNFVADQQARQVVGLRHAGQLAGQPQRAGAEDGRQHAGAAGRHAGHLQAALEGRHVGRRRLDHGAAQDGVAAQRGIDLAGHEGIEVGDLAAARVDPFRVGAGQADQHAVGGVAGLVEQHAEDLRFFAAHHVGQAVTLDQAGDDVHRRGAVALDARQQGADACQVDRHVEVGGFLPALRAADHAAGDHRQLRFGSQPIAAGLFESQFKTRLAARGGGAVLQGLRQAHDAPRQVAGIERAAGVIQAVGAQRRGAPVQRYEGRAGRRSGCHQNLSRLGAAARCGRGRAKGASFAGLQDLAGLVVVKPAMAPERRQSGLGKILDQRLKNLKI